MDAVGTTSLSPHQDQSTSSPQLPGGLTVKACSWILQASSHFSKCSASIYFPPNTILCLSQGYTASQWLVSTWGAKAKSSSLNLRWLCRATSAPELLWDQLQLLGQLHRRSLPPAQSCFIYPLTIIFLNHTLINFWHANLYHRIYF